MTEALDHARCSELLARYVRGELDGPDARAVRDHLAGCPECDQERRGLSALLEQAPSPQLARAEREALLEGVWEAVGRRPAAGEGPAGPARRTRLWFERLSPALAAAALVLLVVGVTTLGGGDGRDGGGGGGGAATERPERRDGPAQVARGVNRPPPFVAEKVALAAEELGAFGRTHPDIAAAAGRSSAPGPGESADLLRGLAERAPSEPLGRQVEECGSIALDLFAARGQPALPAFAQGGTLDGEPALLLGFAWSDDPRGPLDSFAVWVWPRDDCSMPLSSASGRLASP
jgi:hypothetical protein